MKLAHLAVVGGAKPAEYQVKLPCLIGRGQAANLTIPHALVSRLHCKLFEKNGRLAIRDLGSLNGTYVNNDRIDRETYLAPGDVIGIGDLRLETMSKPTFDIVLDAAHDTDLEIAPEEKTQTTHENTVIDFDARMKTIQGPVDFAVEDSGEDLVADPLGADLMPGPNGGGKLKGLPPR